MDLVQGRPRTVQINSNPSGANFTVFDKEGKQVESRTTPATVRLDRCHGFFNGEDYKVAFESAGYYPGEMHIHSKLNGWYFGNILAGGAIGFFFVDPLTGAMWNLSPNGVTYNLVSSTTALNPEELKAAQLKANPVKEAKIAANKGK